MSWSAAFEGERGAALRGPIAANPATLGEIWAANWRAASLDTLGGVAVSSVSAPVLEAYDDLEKAVAGAISRPVADLVSDLGDYGLATPQQRAGMVREKLQTMPEDVRAKIEPYLDVAGRARAKAAEWERQAADVNARAYGVSGQGTAFLAGLARQMVDPVNLVTAPLGGPLKGPVLRMMAREAALGAGVQALQEPFIQTGRATLGLEAGAGEAFGNIAETALGSAGFAGLLRAGGWALRQGRDALRSPIGRDAADVSPAALTSAPAGAMEGSTGSRPAPNLPDDLRAPVRELAESPSLRELTPEDFEAVALYHERNRILDDLSPSSSSAGKAWHARLIDTAQEAFEASRGDALARLDARLADMEARADADIRANDAWRAGRSDASPSSVSSPEASAPRAAPETAPPPSADRVADASDPRPASVSSSAMPARSRAATPAKPLSLVRFLARQGGLPLDAEARHYGWDKVFVPGAGMLAQKNGRSVDSHWREALADAGYIARDADGGISRDIRAELVELIDQETRQKRPVYSMQDRALVERMRADAETRAAARWDEEFRDRVDAELADMHGWLRENGFDPAALHPQDMQDAAELLARGIETSFDNALERVAIMREASDPLPVPAVSALLDDIPGWEDTNAVLARASRSDRARLARAGDPSPDATGSGGSGSARPELRDAGANGATRPEAPDALAPLRALASSQDDPAGFRARLADVERFLTTETGADYRLFRDGEGPVSVRAALDDLAADASALDALKACLGTGGAS